MKESDTMPTGAGKSSFELIDSDKLFRELDLQKGITFLDVACGRGAYCLSVSDIIGPNGIVYAVDLWEEGIESLKAAAEEKGVHNISAFVSNAGQRIPVEDDSIDACLMATVLHDFVEDQINEGVLGEIARVIKPAGILAVMEFKKIEGPPGPPKHIRLSPEDVVAMLATYGFKKERFTDVGPYNYLLIFSKSRVS